jgi:hypothetical protein
VGIVVLRDDECETVMKGNNDGGWSFNGVVIWLVRSQNGDVIK